MVWRKAVTVLVLIGSVVLAGRAIQQFLPHNDSSTQPSTAADPRAVQQASDLIPALLDNDVEIREQAFKKLQALDINTSVPALVQALKDKDWQIRAIAAYTLGRLGIKATPAISELNSKIQDENSDVRIAVAQALGNIGSEKVVPGLVQALQDKDENVRVSAAGALSELGTTVKSASSALTKALWDGNWFVRRRVTKALAVLGPDSIDIPDLIEPIKESRDPSDGAIISLMIGIYPAMLEKPELCAQFFIKGLQSKDSDVRQSAAIALGLVRSTRFAIYDSQAITNALLLALKDQNAQIRSRAAQALGRFVIFGGGKFTPTLGVIETRVALREMLNDEDSQVRSSAAEALDNVLRFYDDVPDPPPELITKIISEATRLLKDQDVNVRLNAIDVLSRFIYKDFPPSLSKTQLKQEIYSSLIDVLYDKDEKVRQKAADTVSSFDRQYNVSLSTDLISAVERKDIDKEIRRSILASNGRNLASSTNGFIALNNALQDEDIGIQQNAALSLYRVEKMSKEATIDVLSKGFDSDDPLTQLDAINGLNEVIGYRSFNKNLDKSVSDKIQSKFPVLNRCLQSPIKPIQWAAAFAINKIEPKQESTVPTLREMLATTTDDTLRGNGFKTLREIDSPQAASAIAEVARLENQEFIYARTCSNGYIPLPVTQRVLLVESLKNEATRQIIAENLSNFPTNDDLDNPDSNRDATVDALILLIQKEKIKPALQPVLNLKNQDLRGSAIYTMGNFLSSDRKSGVTRQKIIDTLTKVMNDSEENLDVRWMAASSLQKAGINDDNFFEQNKIFNPRNAKCPFPFAGRDPGLKFDFYEGRCLYNNKTGCGDGLAQVFNTLRVLLAGLGGGNQSNGNNNSNRK